MTGGGGRGERGIDRWGTAGLRVHQVRGEEEEWRWGMEVGPSTAGPAQRWGMEVELGSSRSAQS